jgi:hypothetical protein
MQTKLSLRFWRVALWGTVTFLLFCILFWYLYRASIAILIEKPALLASVPPDPILPSIIAAVAVLLFVVLSMLVLWKFQLRREPAPLRCRFASYKGNAELCVRLLLLVLLLATGSSVRYTSRIYACRCCLFTTNPACLRGHDSLPSAGFYNFSGYDDGWYSGAYPRSDKGTLKIGNAWLDKFSYEDLPVNRTRFGWPLRAITRDVVPHQPEWHIVFEVWVAVNLFFWFLVWLCIQPLTRLAKWLLRFYKSRGMNNRVPQPSL